MVSDCRNSCHLCPALEKTPQLQLIFSLPTYFLGAPRVLQALARDRLYPKIEFFAPGFGANNDPVRGYILVFCIAVGCILLGEYFF